jgi:cytochrome P450
MAVLKSQQHSLKEQSMIVPILQCIQNPLTALSSIHKNYGDLVLARFFNKKFLFVCKPEHIGQVYSQEAAGKLSRDFLYEAKKSLFGDGLVNSKSEIWTKQRRILQPLFTKEAVAEWENIFIHEAANSLYSFKAAANQQINLSVELKSLIQRIFIKILIGKSVNDIIDSDMLINAIDDISQGLLPHMVTQVISHGKLMWLMPNKKRRYEAAVNRLHEFINREIDIKSDKSGHDLVTLFRRAQDKKTGYIMTKELLKDEVVNLFFAGQDTTVNTLIWFFYLISKHEVTHKLISDEIRTHKEDQLTAENLSKLSYTKAALYETLRLYPPSTMLVTHAVENVVIGAQNISKGTTIILDLFVTHRNEKLWTQPNGFYPKHFLSKGTEIERHKYAFFPFGGGLHNCIGKHFAELEMMIVIVTLLREFTFKSNTVVKEAASMTLKPDRDVMVSIQAIN